MRANYRLFGFTLYLLESSVDNLCQQFGPDLDPNCLTVVCDGIYVFLKELFENIN